MVFCDVLLYADTFFFVCVFCGLSWVDCVSCVVVFSSVRSECFFFLSFFVVVEVLEFFLFFFGLFLLPLDYIASTCTLQQSNWSNLTNLVFNATVSQSQRRPCLLGKG